MLLLYRILDNNTTKAVSGDKHYLAILHCFVVLCVANSLLGILAIVKLLSCREINNFRIFHIEYIFWLVESLLSIYKVMGASEQQNSDLGPVPNIAGQRAIAETLNDMDNEIAALEAKRDKYMAIKQGMMQQLLSGVIRLQQ